jgi:two-component system sensor histidine kinase KdpD
MTASARLTRTWVISWLSLIGVAAAMGTVRNQLDKAHIALAFLIVVLIGSAAGGRLLGILLAGGAFVLFNWLFLPPYGTLVIANPLDWLVLLAFGVTSVVAAQLLARAQREADDARDRAAEVRHLATLGAETLSAGRAEEGLRAVADVIRSTLGISACEIYVRREGETSWTPITSAAGATGAPRTRENVDWVADRRVPAAERADGTTRTLSSWPAGEAVPPLEISDAVSLLIPLSVQQRTVGVLVLANERPLDLDAAQRRFLAALTYYAALGAERVRLVAEAERAEALREADRLKDALLASVSHDLRTPLTTIRALAEEIRADGDERAATIEEESLRLNRFVADLLDLSRLNGGALSLRIEINAIDDLLGALGSQVSGISAGRDVRISIDLAEPVLVGRFDLVQSLRILVNLVENAVKYTPPDAPIEVNARRVGDRVQIAVSDRGAGIPVGEQERIFTAFYRPAHSIPDAGSAGLGLAIARRLAEAQGGQLDYAPRAGGGSVFTLSVPAASL